MLRKPHYCCNCGDAVDRAERRFWHSSRFCELCETEFVFEEWWPRVAQSLIIIAGLTAISSAYLGNNPEPLQIKREVDGGDLH